MQKSQTMVDLSRLFHKKIHLVSYLEPPLKRKQRRVLKRLFRYSRPDWPLITIGTILLLGAALCKYYLI
jgi:hypothetical protein